MKRDSFINGVSSAFFQQNLLENRTLTFTEAYEKARSLQLAKRSLYLRNIHYNRETKSLCVVSNDVVSFT